MLAIYFVPQKAGFNEVYGDEGVLDYEEQVVQTRLDYPGRAHAPAGRGTHRPVVAPAPRSAVVHDGLPRCVPPVSRCPGRVPRLAGLAAFPEHVDHRIDHPIRVDGTYEPASGRVLDS